MEFIQIEVAKRDQYGSSHTRRLRRDGHVPAVLYGLKRDNLDLTIAEPELQRFLRTGSHLVELRMGGETRPAILRELQVDPVSDEILHVDFHRVDHDAEIEDHVAVHFKGRSKGEAEGGMFQMLRETVTVRCKPKNLPSEFLFDISEMAIGDMIRVEDVEAPEGVTLVDDPDELIAQVTVAKHEELPEEVEAEAEGEAPAEGGEQPAPADGEAPAAE